MLHKVSGSTPVPSLFPSTTPPPVVKLKPNSSAVCLPCEHHSHGVESSNPFRRISNSRVQFLSLVMAETNQFRRISNSRVRLLSSIVAKVSRERWRRVPFAPKLCHPPKRMTLTPNKNNKIGSPSGGVVLKRSLTEIRANFAQIRVKKSTGERSTCVCAKSSQLD